MFCTFSTISLHAQLADIKRHETIAENFKTMYNDKNFRDIYLDLNVTFKAVVEEKEFINFLQNDIYNAFGEIKQLQFLSYGKDFCSFLLTFKEVKLRMDVSAGNDLKINGLQLMPFDEIPVTKVLDYLTDNKKRTKLDSVVDTFVSKFIQSSENCGISIGIVKDGNKFFYNYGETKRNSKNLPDQTTIFEIGSLTKTFCGLLLAQAVTEKKINLEDDIRKYLPGNYEKLVFDKTFIRIKHLANHTSGLSRVPEDLMITEGFDSLNPYKNYSRAMIFSYLKTAQINSKPGTACEYSNLGMALLGIILEKVYNQSFDLLVREKICMPNQMRATGVSLSPEELTRFAYAYTAYGTPTPHWELNGFAAAGSLRSTTEDLLNYLDLQLEEKDAAVKLSHQETFNNKQRVALSWFIKKTTPGTNLIWHNGATYGAGSFAGFIKEKNCGVVILANSSVSLDFIAIAILKYLQQ